MPRSTNGESRYRVLVTTLWILSIALAGCPHQAFNPNEALPTLPGVTASLDIKVGTEYSKGTIGRPKEDTVYLWQTIQNGSSRRIKIYGSPVLQVNRVVVRKSDGTKVATTDLWRKHRYPRRIGSVSASSREPGDVKIVVFPLDQLFDLSEPGEYTVEVATRYTVFGPPYEYYATDPEPLTFTVPLK